MLWGLEWATLSVPLLSSELQNKLHSIKQTIKTIIHQENQPITRPLKAIQLPLKVRLPF